MRNFFAAAALAGVSLLAACKKTGEGQYQVETPLVDVKTPSERRGDTAKKRP